MLSMRLVAFTILLFTGLLVRAQTRVIQAMEPGWVEPYRYHTTDDDSSGSSNGYSYLLISLQHHLETKESYRKYAIKVVSEQGLSFASSVDLSFDPSFQKIIVHSLNIIRNGKAINKMDVRKFELIRREEEMDRVVYDKTLNAVYNLPDVRVGDIVEYAYTVKGANTVFNGHSFGNLYLQYGVPVKKFAHRLIFGSGRALQVKAYGDTGAQAEGKTGNLRYYEWIRQDVPALLSDDMVPSWYDPYAHVQYTDFQSWQEVKSWALGVFNLGEPRSQALNDVVDGIKTTHPDDEARIKECIRIAQGDIRYLSFSDGIHGYKPHSPEFVFQNKYGDCKDKSLLLSYLLNRIGIESYPSLVSTEMGKVLNDILPNPWAFNHCVVQFDLNDSTYWIDPTLRPQTGRLKKYSFPSYEHALVINDKPTGLDAIPFGNKMAKIDVLEEYSVDKVGGYVTLEVDTEYHGNEADQMRNYIKTNTKEEIHKNFLNFYAKDYSEISLKSDVEFKDNEVENIIASREEYLLKNFWGLDPEKGKIAYTYARVLSSYVDKPETKLRTMPLFQKHPREISQTIKIFLPEEWNVEDMRNEIESDGFLYRSSFFYNNKTITLRYSYKTKSSFVPTENAVDHINKMDDVLGDISYMIYKSTEEESDTSRTKEFLVVALLIGVVVYVIRRTFK